MLVEWHVIGTCCMQCDSSCMINSAICGVFVVYFMHLHKTFECDILMHGQICNAHWDHHLLRVWIERASIEHTVILVCTPYCMQCDSCLYDRFSNMWRICMQGIDIARLLLSSNHDLLVYARDQTCRHMHTTLSPVCLIIHIKHSVCMTYCFRIAFVWIELLFNALTANFVSNRVALFISSRWDVSRCIVYANTNYRMINNLITCLYKAITVPCV